MLQFLLPLFFCFAPIAEAKLNSDIVIKEQKETNPIIRLSKVKYGDGPKKIYVFSGDTCKYCKIVENVLKDGKFDKIYTFYIVEKRMFGNDKRNIVIKQLFKQLNVRMTPTLMDENLKKLNILTVLPAFEFYVAEGRK